MSNPTQLDASFPSLFGHVPANLTEGMLVSMRRSSLWLFWSRDVVTGIADEKSFVSFFISHARFRSRFRERRVFWSDLLCQFKPGDEFGLEVKIF